MVETGEDFFEDVEVMDLEEHPEESGVIGVYNQEMGVYHLGPDSETFQTAMRIEDEDYGPVTAMRVGAGRKFGRVVNKLIGEPELEGIIDNFTPRAAEASRWGFAVDNTVKEMRGEELLDSGQYPFSYPDPEDDERVQEPLGGYSSPSTPSTVAAELYRDELSDEFIAGVWRQAGIYEGSWHEYCVERLNGD